MARLHRAQRLAHVLTIVRPTWPDSRGSARPWIRVVLHDTVDQLRRTAKRSRPGEDNSEAVGLFMPAPWRERYDKAAKMWLPVSNGLAGTIRLAREHLSTEIVAHECVHAAVHLYRQYHRPDGSVGETSGPDEEILAYYAGELVALVNDALHEMGAWVKLTA